MIPGRDIDLVHEHARIKEHHLRTALTDLAVSGGSVFDPSIREIDYRYNTCGLTAGYVSSRAENPAYNRDQGYDGNNYFFRRGRFRMIVIHLIPPRS